MKFPLIFIKMELARRLHKYIKNESSYFVACICFTILLSNSITGFSQIRNNLLGIDGKKFEFGLQPCELKSNINSISISLKNKYLRIAIFSGVISILAKNYDISIDEEYALEKHKYPFRLIKTYGEIGNLYDYNESYIAIAGLSLAGVGYGIICNEQKPINTVKLMFKSWTITSLVTTIIKVSIGRHRPYTNHGPMKFDLFKFRAKSSSMSFPSGHTASIFALMTVIAKQYDQSWVKYSAYSFATSVAFQRMLYRKHWATDVIVGGLTGYLISNTVVKRHKTRVQKYYFDPFFDENSMGMAFHF